MGVLRTITRNVFSNAAGFFVHAVVAFLLTPFVVNTLGKDAYGIWVLIVACTGYYGLLDLGIRSAVGQYVTRYWAKGDMDGVNRTINTSLALAMVAAGAMLVLTAVLTVTAEYLFNLEGEAIGNVRLAFAIAGAGIAINFPLAIFGSATYARQRFDIANAITIGERLIAAGLYVWVLQSGYGIVGIAIVTTGINLAANLVRALVAFRLLPGLALGRRFFVRASVRELWQFGIFNFLINASDQIVLNSDAIVIGIILSSQALAYYDVGVKPIVYFLGLVNAIAWTLTPYATSCDARGDVEALQRLWLTGTRVIVIVASLLAGGLIFMGEDFLRLWMGEDFVSGVDYVSSATILAVLAVAALLRSAMTCGKQILFGMRKVRLLASISFAEAVTNLVLTLLLVPLLGLIGAVLGTLISVLAVQVWLQPMVLARSLGAPIGRFLRLAPVGGIIVISAMGVSSWLMECMFQVDSWGSFLLKGVALALPASLVGAMFGTTRQEKQKVLARLRGRPLGR